MIKDLLICHSFVSITLVLQYQAIELWKYCWCSWNVFSRSQKSDSADKNEVMQQQTAENVRILIVARCTLRFSGCDCDRRVVQRSTDAKVTIKAQLVGFCGNCLYKKIVHFCEVNWA